MEKRGLPYVEINAKNNYEFGFKLGKALTKEINKRLKQNKIIYKKYGVKDFSELVKKAKNFLPPIKKRFPNLLEEAKGMAEGSGVDFQELFVLMCEEEFISFGMHHCTSVAIKTLDNKTLLGHNEDWISEYRKNGLALIKGKIRDKRFLALSFIGSLTGTSCGLAYKGVAFTGNSLSFKRVYHKTPRSFELRALLEVNSLKEAISTLKPRSSINSNTMLVCSHSEIDFEEFCNHDEIFKGKKFLVHTNHPLMRKEQNKKNTDKDSILRFNRAREILLKEKKLTINTLKKLLRDHKAEICDHTEKGLSKGVTIASVIINPNDKYMLVCLGNPCKNKYKKYKL